jgi:hypothetical protein
MKLRQNARELVLVEVSGLGILLGEIRYNKQTETVLFALEKASFFDLYFPCAVVYDQQKGAVVHPHIVNTMTTSSIRIQRSRVSFFVLEADLAPSLRAQYLELINSFIGLSKGSDKDAGGRGPEKVDSPAQTRHRGPTVVPLDKLKDSKGRQSGKDEPDGRQ